MLIVGSHTTQMFINLNCLLVVFTNNKKGPQRKNVRAITVKPLTMSYAAQIYKYLIKFIFLIKLIKLILC